MCISHIHTVLHAHSHKYILHGSMCKSYSSIHPLHWVDTLPPPSLPACSSQTWWAAKWDPWPPCQGQTTWCTWNTAVPNLSTHSSNWGGSTENSLTAIIIFCPIYQHCCIAFWNLVYLCSTIIQTDLHLPSSHNSITDLLMSRTMRSTPQFSCSWTNRARKVLANHGTATTSHGDPHTISSLWNCGIVSRFVASPDCRWSLAETKTQKIKECKNAIKSSPNY